MASNPEETLGPEHCGQTVLFQHLHPQFLRMEGCVGGVHKAGDAVLFGLRGMSLPKQLLLPTSCQRCAVQVKPA